MSRTFERFLFAPGAAPTVALVSRAYGALLLAWTLSLLGGIEPFFSSDGIVPEQPALPAGGWSLFALSGGTWLAFAAWAALVVAALALVAGRCPSVAAAAAFVLVTSFQHRNPVVFNAGDGLIRILALYLALVPLGGRLVLRLMQVQLSVIYLDAVLDKLRGDTWLDGTALAYALQLEDLQRVAVPFVIEHPALTAALTYGTLAIELAIAVLVWLRRARPWVLGAGISLHLGVALTMDVGFFSPVMLVLYLAFVPPERASRLAGAVRVRLRRSRPAVA